MRKVNSLLSMAVGVLFSVSALAQQINKAEYFFDADPGVGHGTAITITTAADSVDISGSINTTGLPAGFHTLCIRTRNDSARWSLYEARRFYVNAPNNSAALQITGAEYFFDSDPGIGNGTAITTGAAADSIDVNHSSSTTGLLAGFHTLVIRVKNSGGIWSLYDARRFYLDAPSSTTSSQIVNAESFFDADPGQGNGTPVSPSFAAADSVDLNRSISSTGLALGTHYLYTRVQDQNGNWSLAVGDTFQIIQVGINEIANGTHAFLYPNPMTAYTILQFDAELSNAEVVIYDILGKEMMRAKLTGDRMVIKRGTLVSGLYFVRVADEEKQWTERMVVE